MTKDIDMEYEIKQPERSDDKYVSANPLFRAIYSQNTREGDSPVPRHKYDSELEHHE